jgi:class 3 adenylate cyclase
MTRGWLVYPIVVVKQPNRKALQVQLIESIEVGRECDGLLLADPQTSRRHARLDVRGNDVVVEDLGSTNGTFLDGERTEMPVVLRPGSVVRLGDTTLELLVPAADASRATAQGGAGSRATVAAGGGGRVRAAGDAPKSSRETSIDVVARAVRDTRPELAEYDYEGTITIVFSDIEASTERATSMGDTAWMKVLNLHNEIVRRNVKQGGGREVKNQGDGFMLTFPGARRALQAMIAVQRELARMEHENPEGSVRIRVGVHTGEVIAEGGDIFGRHVMMAARVAGLAQGGQILTSAVVHEIASARGDLVFGEPAKVQLKGIEGEHIVFPLQWEEQAEP